MFQLSGFDYSTRLYKLLRLALQVFRDGTLLLKSGIPRRSSSIECLRCRMQGSGSSYQTEAMAAGITWGFKPVQIQLLLQDLADRSV